LELEAGATTPVGGFHTLEVEPRVDPTGAGGPGDAVGGGPVAVNGDGDEGGTVVEGAGGGGQAEEEEKKFGFHSEGLK